MTSELLQTCADRVGDAAALDAVSMRAMCQHAFLQTGFAHSSIRYSYFHAPLLQMKISKVPVLVLVLLQYQLPCSLTVKLSMMALVIKPSMKLNQADQTHAAPISASVMSCSAYTLWRQSGKLSTF